VPDSTGDNLAGKVGKDYVDIATESQIEYGELAAEWLAKTLGGKATLSC
jgi:ABC-type sugar transport system substrate-binding protein